MIDIIKTKRCFSYKKTFGIILVMCLVFFQAISVSAWQSDNGDGTFTNPPLYADYPDPSIIRVGDYFYLASSTFVNVPGLVICRSEDLVNWEIAGHCITTLTGNNAYNMIGGVKYGGGCFAPSIAYKDGTFYVVATPNGEPTRIYSAKDVAGPWSVSTLSGSYFDPALFIEDDGTAYLAYGGAWENKISMIQLNSSLSATVGSSKVILAYNNIEGTHLIKAKGKYYLFNAVPARSLVCSRSNTLWGPYGETTTLCTAGKGGHQGGIVDLPDGSYWGYVHQDDGAIGRPTRICPITWEDGWPKFGSPGKTGQIESKYTKPIANKAIKVPAASDEFNGSSLGLQWMWNHNPDNTKWSFTGSALRLKASTGSDFWHARNSLTQKGQGLTSSGNIKVDCSKMQSGDICGLGMLGDPRGYIAVTKDPKRIIMSEEDTVKATVSNITSDILYFRVEMNFGNKQAKFFWKDDEAKSWQPLGTTITMGFDWQYGTFQGEQYAILNYNTGASTGYCDIDWFRLNDVKGPDANETPGPTPTPTPTPVPRSAFSQTEAEDFSSQSGIQTEACSEGGEDVGYIENGDYVVYSNIDFGSGAKSFQVRTASGTEGGKIEIRVDSVTGPLVGNCPVSSSGDWQTWVNTECDVEGVSGVHDLYLRFTGGSGYLFNINWWKFVADDTVPTPIPTPVKSIDVNHDGAINMTDVMIVAGSFNSVRGDSRYVEAYDLNSDGAVSMTDIMILAAKFNTIVTSTNTPTSTPTKAPTATPSSSSGVLPSVASVERDGPFTMAVDKNVGPGNKGVVVRPSSLGTLGVEKHPIFIWGPGGGSDPMYYELLLRRLSTMGFVIYSEASTGDGTEMKAALDWIIAQNSNSSSPYYNKLDTTRIGAGGHSLGSGSAYILASDPRISTTIHCDGGSLDGLGASRMRKPTALLCGLDDNLALGNTENDYKKATVPIWYGGIKGGGHGAGPFDGIPAVAAWARWHIAGETGLKSMFIGQGAVFNTGIWQSQYKNW